MRKRGRESRTAVCSSTGILTGPNAIEPFHRALAMEQAGANPKPQSPNAKSEAESQSRRVWIWVLGFGLWDLLLRPSRTQLPLSLHPIVEVLAVASAAAQVAVIRGLGDFVVRRGRRVGWRCRGGRGRHVCGRIDGSGSLRRRRRARRTTASRTG